MLWYVLTFIAGMMFGIVGLVLSLALLNNNKIDETEDDDSVLNQDGTPKRITFNKDDL
jgi:hypothetical protein